MCMNIMLLVMIYVFILQLPVLSAGVISDMRVKFVYVKLA